ncbi:uncharacterized protein LOC125134939 [Phacochoerus africanus]|uniref:uncharacterized protein LOC125134939 n=1 Tax=Phacochoerus africanus TaxID=41426 RepID=UPI001FD8FF30|nr:uncharacterized protein LOC125134939 [Phacochoerus africanus]
MATRGQGFLQMRCRFGCRGCYLAATRHLLAPGQEGLSLCTSSRWILALLDSVYSREQGPFSLANMLSATHPVLVIFLIIGGSNGDSVNQTEVPVVLLDEAPMTLNCTYETLDSAPYLFWYVQYLNRAPQLLLKGSTAKPRAEEQGFQATLVKSDKTFHLQKRSVQTSDSAVYYCALSDTVRGAAGGAEHKPRGHRWDWLWAALGGGFFSVSALACWRHPQGSSSSDAQSQDPWNSWIAGQRGL